VLPHQPPITGVVAVLQEVNLTPLSMIAEQALSGGGAS